MSVSLAKAPRPADLGITVYAVCQDDTAPRAAIRIASILGEGVRVRPVRGDRVMVEITGPDMSTVTGASLRLGMVPCAVCGILTDKPVRNALEVSYVGDAARLYCSDSCAG